MSTQNFTLKNNNVFVYAEAPGGVYTGKQLKFLAELTEDDSCFIKITEDQRVGFIAAPENLPDYQKQLATVGLFLRDYRSTESLSPKACLGEVCPFSEQDALGDCIELSALLSEKFSNSPHYLKASLNGCAQACVDSATDDISIVGEKLGYKIFIGGKNAEPPVIGKLLTEKISKEHLGETISKILLTYFEQREEKERLYDLVERIGVETFLTGVLSQTVKEGKVDVPRMPMEEDKQDKAAPTMPVEEDKQDEAAPPMPIEEDKQDEIAPPMPLEGEESQEEVPLSIDNMPTKALEEPAEALEGNKQDETAPLALESSITPIDEEEDESLQDAFAETLETKTENQEPKNNVSPIEALNQKIAENEIFREKGSSKASPGNKTKIKFGSDALTFQLENRSEIRIALSQVRAEENLEIEVGDGILTMENNFGETKMKYGAIEMTIPDKK